MLYLYTVHMGGENNVFGKWPAISKEQWLEQIRRDLKGADFNEKLVSVFEGIRIQPVYTEADVPPTVESGETDFDADFEWEEEGTPITWSVCREMDFNKDSDIYTLGDPDRNNGAMCVRISGDVPFFLQQFRLVRPAANHFTLHVDNDLSSPEIVNQYRDLINNLSGHQLYVTAIEFDPIGYWMKTGAIPNRDTSFNHLADLFIKLAPKLHDCKLFHVDATITAEAGADITDQLAYTLAIATEYIEALLRRNIPLEEIIPLFHFRMSVGSNYFFEIAKLQAFQRLWINLVKAFDPDADFIMPAYIHAVVTQTNIAAEDRHTNLLRSTTEAMSAILGGCEVLSVLPFDLHHTIKDENAERLALNMQHLLRYESSFDQYRNIAEGAYYLESITTAIAEKAWNSFTQLQTDGGFISNLQNGNISKAIHNSRLQKEHMFENKNIEMVGVNIFQNAEEHVASTENIQPLNSETQFAPILPFYFNNKKGGTGA